MGQLTTGSRGKGSVGKALSHLDKHEYAADISRPELSAQNHSFVSNPLSYKECKDLAKEYAEAHNKAVDEWNKTHEKQKRHLRKDASQFFEGLFTYSPEMERVINYVDWVRATREFVVEEFVKKGCKVLRFDLHRDEATTHIQMVGLAWNEKEKNCTSSSILGNRRALCELQDRYAEAMKQFGLERGYSRYRAYDSVRKKAIAAGYEDNVTSVAEFAEKNGYEIPRYRGHKPLGKWKAEQEQIGIEFETRNEVLLQSVRDLQQIKAELSELIPERYCKVVNKAESFEKLLEIGKRVPMVIKGHETTLTDYLELHSRGSSKLAKDFAKDFDHQR